MADQMRPASPQQAPDPSDTYERSHPGREAGMGRLENEETVPQRSPDKQQAAPNGQNATRAVAGHDTINQRGGPVPVQPDHSMKDEEPLGWDQAPLDIHDPERQRQPRTEGKGGTP